MAGIAISLIDTAFIFGSFAPDAHSAYLRNPGSLRLSASCALGGNVFLDLTDRNADGVPSANDTVRVTYDSCRSDGETVTGTFDIAFTNVAQIAGEQVVAARINLGAFSITQPGSVVSFTGHVVIEHRRGTTQDSVTLSTTQLSVVLDGEPETLTALNHRVVQDFASSTYQFTTSGSVDSAVLGGDYDFATVDPWRGTLGSFPTAGVLRFSGAANSTLRLVEGDPRESVSDQTMLFVDANGDGTEETAEPASWSRFTDTIVFASMRNDSPVPNPPPPPPPPPGGVSVSLKGRAFGLAANDIRDVVSDPARRRVYLSVRNEIAVLSTDTYLVESLFFVGSRPTGLALSADGARLYVALGAGGSVAIVDLETYQVSTVAIATEMASPNVLDVIEVRPGVILASGVRNAGEVYLLTIDTQDNNRIRRVAGGEVVLGEPTLAATPDRRYVFVGNRSSPALILKLDAQLPDLPIIARSSPTETSGIAQLVSSRDGTRLMTGGGQIWDATTMRRISSGFVDGNVAADRDHLRLMQVGSVFALTLRDGVDLRELSSYTTDCPQRVMNGITSVGLRDEWILNLSGQLCIVSLSSPDVRPGVDGNRALPPRIEPVGVGAIETAIGGRPWDMQLDAARNVAYASIPGTNEIVVVPIDTGGVADVLVMPGQPRRMAMSVDGMRLYVALWGSGRVAIIDLQTRQLQGVLDLAALLGDPGTHALIEAAPGRLFVAASPETGERTFLVEVDPDNPGSARRVGSAAGYQQAWLYVSASRDFLYVADTWWPTLIEKRDLSSPMLDVVMTSEPQGTGDLGHAALSPDGARMYLQSGAILSTTTLRQIGLAIEGLPRVSADNREVSIVLGPQVLTYRADTLEWVASVISGCISPQFPEHAVDFDVMPDRSRFVILGSLGGVCVMNSAP